MEKKKVLFHRAHILLGLYITSGGFLPYVRVYNWISAVVIFGWVIFGRCIANDGYDYKKGSLMEEVLGDGGSEMFQQVLTVGQIFAAVRLQEPLSLVTMILYQLKSLKN